MVEVSIAGRRASQIVGPQPYPSADLGQIENVIVRPINRENLEFSPNQLGDSTYYDYKGQYLEKEGRPVQPLERITLTPLDNGFVAKGTILLSASYRDELNFKPLFGQPWALSSLNTAVSQINPNDLLGGWDHQRPYLISPHNSQLQSEGKLSLIYGAYHAETGIERLFENMSLEVIYADPNNQDLIPPVIDQTSSFIYAGTGPVKLSVRPIDESDIVRSVGVCDDGNGSWTTTELSKAGNSWVGECSSNSVRSYVHVIDAAGNVAVTEWQSPVNLVDSIYLPAITNRLYNLPDLTIQSVVNTTSNVEIVIKNQGTHGVTFEDRFYVDLYFDPDPAPLGVNETWDDGRSKHGAIWRISTNLAPGDTLTLSKDDAYYWQEGSNWPDTISDSVEIYAQVDSANYGTASGAVLELDEVNDAPYNNVFGPTRAKSHDYYLWEERKKGFIYPSQWLEWTYSEWPRRSED